MRRYLFLILFMAAYYPLLAQDENDGYPHPRPKNCDTENSCPRNALFHETTIRFDRLGLNWNSLNWDHNLICRERYLLSFTLGINYMSFAKIRSVGAPLELNLMIGGGALMFETGIGLNYLYIYRNYDELTGKFDDNLSYLAAIGRLGLRFQKQHNVFFRIGYTPLYSLIGNDEINITNKKGVAVIHDKPFYSMYGAGIGYTF
jgi:hypothetical protein